MDPHMDNAELPTTRSQKHQLTYNQKSEKFISDTLERKLFWKEVFSFNRNETNFKSANYHPKGVWMTLHGHSISQQSISIGNESGAEVSKT